MFDDAMTIPGESGVDVGEGSEVVAPSAVPARVSTNKRTRRVTAEENRGIRLRAQGCSMQKLHFFR